MPVRVGVLPLAAFIALGGAGFCANATGDFPDSARTVELAVPYAPGDMPHLLDRRIDHVLARPGRPGQPLPVRGAFVAGDRPFGGVYPSDHYAVGVDLEP